MENIKIIPHRNIISVLLVASMLCRGASAVELCQHGVETTRLKNLVLESSPIAGSDGMCSCKITLLGDAQLSIYFGLTGCNTGLSLSDDSYTLECPSPRPYIKEMTRDANVWLFVKSNPSAPPVFGILQIKTPDSGPQFSIECFDPNTNSSITTPQLTTFSTARTPPQITTPSPSTATSTTSSTQQVPGVSTSTTNPSQQSTSTQQQGGETTAPAQQPQSSQQPSGKSTTAPANTSPGTDSQTNDDGGNFPVAAVVGGVIGGIVVIAIISMICHRKRYHHGHHLHENKDPSMREHGHVNNAYDNGTSAIIIPIKQPKTQQVKNPETDHIDNGHHGTPNSPGIPTIVVTDTADQYTTLDDVNQREGTSRKEDEFKPSGDVNAVPNVNKSQGQDNDVLHWESPSGDVYAVPVKHHPIGQSEGPSEDTDIDESDQNNFLTSSGDLYVVPDKPKGGFYISSDDGDSSVNSYDLENAVYQPAENTVNTAEGEEDETEAIKRIMAREIHDDEIIESTDL